MIDQEWAEGYGSRIDDLHLPESETKRTALGVAYGRDGYRLLDAVYATGAPVWLAELPAVAALRRIWVQQYYRVIDTDGEKVIRREATEQGLGPGRAKLVSPYDLDARYSEKRGTGWTGYKAHFTPDLPHRRRGRPGHRPARRPEPDHPCGHHRGDRPGRGE